MLKPAAAGLEGPGPMRHIIRNVSVFDGSGAQPVPGLVVTSADRIKEILPADAPVTPAAGDVVIDGRGGMLMPGLVEALRRGPGVRPASMSARNSTSIVSPSAPAEYALVNPESSNTRALRHVATFISAGGSTSS